MTHVEALLAQLQNLAQTSCFSQFDSFERTSYRFDPTFYYPSISVLEKKKVCHLSAGNKSIYTCLSVRQRQRKDTSKNRVGLFQENVIRQGFRCCNLRPLWAFEDRSCGWEGSKTVVKIGISWEIWMGTYMILPSPQV